MNASQTVILVDEQDNPLMTADKYEAHRLGQLHRAFSVFIFRQDGPQLELLMQKRAADKYHSGGLWTNTCCGHPTELDENIAAAATRRLLEEMGFHANLSYIDRFHYKVQFSNGLWENEIDHVFMAILDVKPLPDPKEIAAYQWVSVKELMLKLDEQPSLYTYWLRPALEIIKHKTDLVK